ncbi:uncharacterized protein [Amphiura filiformis]|uniref:uncharacterized protein isoform X2 n=1 Tax=Amphiura filiformis TaxID=82378 RepID=UPI003B22693B
MLNLCRVSLCCFLLVLFHVRWGYCGEKEDERTENTVFIRYNECTVERWGKDPEDTGIDNTENMKMTVADLVKAHCDDNLADCSLSSSSEFTMDDVVLSADSPLYFNGDVKMSFYVNIEGKSLTGDDDDTEYVLPQETLSIICEEGKDALTNATNGGLRVDFVGDKRVGPPLDGTLNKIMIPLSLCLVILLAVIAVVMNHYHQKEDKEHLPTGSQGDDVVMTAVKPKDKEGAGSGASKQNPTA